MNPELGTDIPVSVERDECQKAADALMAAFVWSDTSEGDGFWSAIYKRFVKMAEQPNPSNAQKNCSAVSATALISTEEKTK